MLARIDKKTWNVRQLTLLSEILLSIVLTNVSHTRRTGSIEEMLWQSRLI